MSEQTPPSPPVIVGFGASTMRGVRPGVEEHDTFLSLLEHDLNAAGVPARTINAGIPGNTTTDALTRFERDVLKRRPHMVLLNIGINDSWVDAGKSEPRVPLEVYRHNYCYIVGHLKALGTRVVIMTLQPQLAPAHPSSANVNMKPHVRLQRQIAREEGLPLVDVYARFCELAMEGVDLNTLYTDGQHPNPLGHRVIADLLLELEQEQHFFSLSV